MFSKASTNKTGNNKSLLTYKDADKTDSADTLLLNVTSKKDNNLFRFDVRNSKSSFKIIPGETHRVVLGNVFSNNNQRSYYIETPEGSSLGTVAFEMFWPKDDDISYSLRLATRNGKKINEEEIPLNPVTISTSQRSYNQISQNIEVRYGTYSLTLTNNNPDKQSNVKFRVIVNSLLEIEENGVRKAKFPINGKERLQLTTSGPGQLNVTLLTCKSNIKVFLSDKLDPHDNYGLDKLLVTTQDKISSGESLSAVKYFPESSTVYLTVADQTKQHPEYTLVTSFLPASGSARADNVMQAG